VAVAWISQAWHAGVICGRSDVNKKKKPGRTKRRKKRKQKKDRQEKQERNKELTNTNKRFNIQPPPLFDHFTLDPHLRERSRGYYSSKATCPMICFTICGKQAAAFKIWRQDDEVALEHKGEKEEKQVCKS